MYFSISHKTSLSSLKLLGLCKYIAHNFLKCSLNSPNAIGLQYIISSTLKDCMYLSASSQGFLSVSSPNNPFHVK